MTIVLKNARIIDCKGGILEQGFIKFDEEGIIEISEQALSADTEIDATKKTVMPGLFDCHTHLGMSPVLNTFETVERDNETMTALKAYDQCTELIKYGVTTVRNMGTKFDSDITLRDMINTKQIKGPRILASGRIIAITGGHGHTLAIESDTEDEALKAARTQIKKTADVLKLIATGGVLTKGSVVGSSQLSLAQMLAVCREAEATGRLTAAHCIGYEGLKNAVFAGVQSVEHGHFIDKVIGQKMLETGVFLSPTLIAGYVLAHYEGNDTAGNALRKKTLPIFDYQEKAFRLCRKMGIKIAASSDLGAALVKPGMLVNELSLYVKYGMSNMEALMCATKNASELCRLNKIVGTLEPGKLADIIVIDGNPIENIADIVNIEMTFKDGEAIYKR